MKLNKIIISILLIVILSISFTILTACSDIVLSTDSTTSSKSSIKTTVSDNSQTDTDSSSNSSNSNQDNSTDSTTDNSSSSTDTSGDEDASDEPEYYTITFVTDSNVTVTVYETQDMTSGGSETTTAYSRNSETGALTATDGQVNFVLTFADGYEISDFEITGSYKNLKGSADTGVANGYRITKISSDLTITITSQAIDSEDTTGAYKATFVLENCVVYVYETQDTTGDGELTTTAYARDGSLGTLANDGTGQVNFVVVCDTGYSVDLTCIVISGGYTNLKSLGDNAYRVTKITSDLTIEITAVSTETAASLYTSYVQETTYNSENYSLLVEADSGEFTTDYSSDTLTISSDNALEITLSGTYYGAIVINCANDVTINLYNANLTALEDSTCPLYINTSGDAAISAKQGTTNKITDSRAYVDDSSLDVSASIYCNSDLKLKGSGTLTIYSANNNGIHSKDDLTVQKITLTVNCLDNALKGNDYVSIESGTLTLIARQGDGIKTSNSSLSSTNEQKGSISITGGNINIYAACDGIDAAYNVEISGTTPVINIYTDKYSSYSEEVTAVSDGTYYIKASSTSYKYSIYYYNSSTDYVWENASTSYTTVSSGRSNSYYYTVTKPSGYSYMIIYVYSSSQTQGQSSSYTAKSSSLTINDSYDTISVTVRSSSCSTSWTNYTTQQSSGMGGMQEEGNTDKGDYSTKGIKADNAIIISAGTIYIEAYDDAIHANSDNALESGATPSGNVTISGGTLTLFSNDDGIHADGILTISNGTVSVTNSYEGLEGYNINISGGNVSVVSSDDGMNGTATSGSGVITISGGSIYVYAGGDGIDSNSKTQYGGITFAGGHTVVISTSSNNSCIDTESGYTYTGGYVVAICPTGMQSESTNCSNFSSVGKSTTMSLTSNYYLTVSNVAVIKIPTSISNGFAMCLGSSSTSFSSSSSTSYTLDSNGVYWMV